MTRLAHDRRVDERVEVTVVERSLGGATGVVRSYEEAVSVVPVRGRELHGGLELIGVQSCSGRWAGSENLDLLEGKAGLLKLRLGGEGIDVIGDATVDDELMAR